MRPPGCAEPPHNEKRERERVNSRLLGWMQCPWCGDAFTVEAFEGSIDTNVEEGLLRSGCGRVFPIVRGIPRVLPDSFSLQPDFARRYAARLPAQVPQAEADAADADAIRRTRESFGYQWTVF